MKKIGCLLLIIVISSCDNGINNDISFEGKVDYTVTVDYSDAKFEAENAWYVDQQYGEFVELYINSDGDLLKKYPESGEYGFDFMSYIVDENKGYAKWRGIDTIYGHDTAINSLEFIRESKGRSERILGYECQSIEYYGFEPIGQDTIVIKQFYSDEICLNSEPYQNCKDFFADEIYSKINSVPLMTIINYGAYTVELKAVKIEQGRIDHSIFELDEKYPIKSD